MTAINILKQRDAVHILSDGAMWNAEGCVIANAPKCFQLPHVNAAVAIRGPALGLPMIAECMSGFNGYDDMKRGAVDALHSAIDSIRAMTQHPDLFGDVQLFVGGWSESTDSDAYTILTEPSSGVPAWEVVSLAEHSFTPFDANGPVHHAIWDIFAGRSVNELDPRVDGLAIMEAQRRHKAATSIGRVHVVGGFAQLTTVTAKSITTEILKRWSDKVGKKINPLN